MTCSTNFVVLLGTISPAGVCLGFTPQQGRLAAFTLVLDPHGALGFTEIPCELLGALAACAEGLVPGALVSLVGALAVRDAELGEDTGRLVVVGTALTVVAQGEAYKEPVPREVLERGLARFAAEGRGDAPHG